MSEQFQPGDLVECVVHIAQAAPCGCPPPVFGAVYTVTEVLPPVYRHECGLVIAELPVRPGHSHTPGYGASNFRKIYRPDPKLIERLTAEPVIMPPVRQPNRVDA